MLGIITESVFRFLQNAEQNSAIDKRKTLKQITPPPESPNGNRRFVLKKLEMSKKQRLFLGNL